MKPRQRIRPISKARAPLLREYAKVKRTWREAMKLVGLWVCRRCGGTPDDSPHHLRGRIGALLCHHAFFVPVCGPCHDWIHRNPEEARKIGLLCKKGDWGKQPDEP